MNNRDFVQAKAEGRRLSMVTCYDYTFARLLSTSAIDGILVGDSAAMVMHGHRSTLSATVDLMRLHTEAVARGAEGKFIVADMPFLSFRKGLAVALDAAHALMSAGAHAVKLEGVDGHEDVIQRVVQSGIPVMGHLGLQPQSVHAYGGYRVQGRERECGEGDLAPGDRPRETRRVCDRAGVRAGEPCAGDYRGCSYSDHRYRRRRMDATDRSWCFRTCWA